MNAQPPIEILDSVSSPNKSRDVPLHAQVRQAMHKLIVEHFEDGQQFWTEQALTERLNVSQITVRRALSDLTKDGILYRQAAKGTFVRKPNNVYATDYRVGVFVPGYNSNILSSLLDQLSHLSADRGQAMNTYFTHKGQRIVSAFRRIEHSAENLRLISLGNPHDATCELIELAKYHSYRIISVEGTVPGNDVDYVGVDDREGMRLALDHLVQLGHRRIALIVNEPFRLDQVIQRQTAFEEIGRSLKIDAHVFNCKTQYWESAHDAAYKIMPAIWEGSHKPTAIVAVSDAGAWAVLRWLSEHGVRVPQDVSVMGFDDDLLSNCTNPRLSTLGRDCTRMAEEALSLLDQPSPRNAEVLIKPNLIERESTGPAPS